MNKRTPLVLGIAALAIGMIGLAVTSAFLAMAPGRSQAGGGVGGGDAHFIEQMIPHHDDAIEMADMAIERAEHPELRRLARDIKESQTRQNEQMRGWYSDWYGEDVGPGRMGGMMERMANTDMDALESSDEFDKEFIEQMVPHHRMALMMSHMAGRSDRAEMRQLADEIMDDQSREIEQMLEWYDEWYGG